MAKTSNACVLSPNLGDRERQYVFSVAMKYLKDEDAAEDVTQDALLLAHRHRDSFRGDSRFSTWLYRVAATTALMYLRKQRRRRRARCLSCRSASTTERDDARRRSSTPIRASRRRTPGWPPARGSRWPTAGCAPWATATARSSGCASPTATARRRSPSAGAAPLDGEDQDAPGPPGGPSALRRGVTRRRLSRWPPAAACRRLPAMAPVKKSERRPARVPHHVGHPAQGDLPARRTSRRAAGATRSKLGDPGQYPVHARPARDDVPRQAVDDAHVRRLRHARGHQPALQVPARARPDRPVDRLRHADADGLRPRPPALARRGRPRGRVGRVARRHGCGCSATSRSTRCRPR